MIHKTELWIYCTFPYDSMSDNIAAKMRKVTS